MRQLNSASEAKIPKTDPARYIDETLCHGGTFVPSSPKMQQLMADYISHHIIEETRILTKENMQTH
jgi:hypothetical protein